MRRRRKSLKELSGYSNAKRQTTRKMGGSFGVEVIGIVLVGVLLAVIFLIQFIAKNMVLFGVLAAAALIAGVVWFGILGPKRKRERLLEEARQAREQARLAAEEEERRRQQLMAKYGDKVVVDGIMKGSIWTGQTAEMLTDTLGPPEAIDEKKLKTKKKQIWKYGHEGGSRYGVRVTLDDDEVVKWSVKDAYINS